MENIVQDALSRLTAICTQPQSVEIAAVTTDGPSAPSGAKTKVAAVNNYLAHAFQSVAFDISEKLRRGVATKEEVVIATLIINSDTDSVRTGGWKTGDGRPLPGNLILMDAAHNIAWKIKDGQGTEADRRAIFAVLSSDRGRAQRRL